MHFILSPVGSAGDVHPYLGLAIAMRERGHRVTFVINGYFHDLVASHGFEQLEFGTAEQFLEASNHPDLWHPRRAMRYVMHWVLKHAMRQYELVMEAYQPGSRVLSSCLGFGALMAQDKHNIPVRTIHLQPSVIWSMEAPAKLPALFGPPWLQYWMRKFASRYAIPWIIGRPLNRLRSELQLPPVRDVMQWWNSKLGVLALFPDWYCAPAGDWPPTLQADFPLWDAGDDQPLATEVRDFLKAGESPIAFTPGSANRFAAHHMSEFVAACQQLKRRAILLTKFREQVPANLPDSVAAFSYVPYSRLLPHCAASVHHGGIGTTAQGLQAGIPQLIMALAHDQYDNGDRIMRLGAGAWVPSGKFRAGRIADVLESLLSPRSQQQARSIAARTRTDGLARAVKLLEDAADGDDRDDTNEAVAGAPV
ncbi:MAG: glycosyltransferase family 1 protein [Planctomycetales bacterium]|nr:glycosyltransferase family 1 protein [Planctomycetales bacterium]